MELFPACTDLQKIIIAYSERPPESHTIDTFIKLASPNEIEMFWNELKAKTMSLTFESKIDALNLKLSKKKNKVIICKRYTSNCNWNIELNSVIIGHINSHTGNIYNEIVNPDYESDDSDTDDSYGDACERTLKEYVGNVYHDKDNGYSALKKMRH